MKKVAYVGIDYHMSSLSIVVMVEGEKGIHETARVANEDKVILKYFKRLSGYFGVRSCYEGFVSLWSVRSGVGPWHLLDPSAFEFRKGAFYARQVGWLFLILSKGKLQGGI